MSLQIGIKAKYGLTVDRAEHDEPARVLSTCPAEKIISTAQIKGHVTSGGASADAKPDMKARVRRSFGSWLPRLFG